MRSHFKFLLVLAALSAAFSLATNSTRAVELLTDGGFEAGGTSPLGWSLEEFATGSGTILNSAEQIGFAPESTPLDLWLRAFVGGEGAGPDNLSNAILSQSAAVVAGEEYTFSGYSRWEDNYSGGATTLDAAGPLGAVASPTETNMELAFFDAGGSVIGTPIFLDLRTEQSNFDLWQQHTLVGTAPAGAVEARVTAEARDMVWNGGDLESAFYDTFSLTGAGAPSTELLTNPDLEEPPAEFGDDWVITQVAGGNIPGDPTVSTEGFANRPGSGGALGAWLRAFTGSSSQPADATLSQTVDGMAGGDYTFSGWSRWETNYSGGDPSFATETIMELAFLDAGGTEIGTPELLDLSTQQSNDGTWREHTLNATAPAGTVSVRITGAGLGMEDNPLGGAQSAFFDDFSLMLASASTDADGDGDVDGQDFLLLQRNDPSLISQWEIDYGSGSLSATQSVPEPNTAILLMGLLALSAAKRRSTN